MRFVRSGINWEGRAWTTPASLRALLDEVEAQIPEPRKDDGTVSNAIHDAANPTSDHRPVPWTGAGTVRAGDIGEEGDEGDAIFGQLLASRDPRIKYVIHNRLIFASYDRPYRAAWTPGPYDGYNAHLTHVHVSLLSGSDADGRPWNLELEDMSQMVKDIQQSLNAAGFTDGEGKALKQDGIWGDSTHEAFRKMTKAAAKPKGPKGDPGPPGVVNVKVNGTTVFP